MPEPWRMRIARFMARSPHDRGRFDLDQKTRIRQCGNANPRGRWLGWPRERFGDGGSDGGRLFGLVVNDVDAEVHDVVQRAAAGFDGDAEIAERVAGLRSEVVSADE